MSNKNFLTAIAYCLLPLLLYYVVYEAAVCVLRLCLSYVVQAGGAVLMVWSTEHAGDVSALIGAAAMALGFAAIHTTAAQEAPLTRRGYAQRQRGEKRPAAGEDAKTEREASLQASGTCAQAQTGSEDPPGRVCPASAAAAVLLALSAALFLNLAISMSGASASDAGASSAAAQTAAVSLPLGLLYYGILSPFIEETVFRGITYGRIRTVLRAQSAKGTGKDAELGRGQSVKYAASEEFGKDTASEAPAKGISRDFAQTEQGVPSEDSAQGTAQTALQKRHIIAAAVLSSLLFGIYHGNFVQGCYAFCMGLIFCAFLEMMGSLAAAAFLHGAVNALTLLLSQSGLYARLCTPAWLAASFAIAACSAICLARQSR